MKEVWKDVVGYEDYFKVSNAGRVFSKRTNKILKQRLNKRNRCELTTRIGGRSGKALCFKVHRLVATAFIENEYNKPEVNHKDGCSSNNLSSNLEWCTKEENIEHAIENGLLKNNNKIGCESPHSLLNEQDIWYIRENYKAGCKINGCRALALKYNISHYVISDIINNKKYLISL